MYIYIIYIHCFLPQPYCSFGLRYLISSLSPGELLGLNSFFHNSQETQVFRLYFHHILSLGHHYIFLLYHHFLNVFIPLLSCTFFFKAEPVTMTHTQKTVNKCSIDKYVMIKCSWTNKTIHMNSNGAAASLCPALADALSNLLYHE